MLGPNFILMLLMFEWGVLLIRCQHYLSIHPSVYLSIYLSLYLSLSLSLSLSVCLSICLSTCLSASLKTKLFCETSSFFEVDNIKTKQFCKTSSFFEVDHIKNEAILRDLLIFPKLTTSQTKQFCETSSIFQLGNIKNKAILRDFLQKWKVECRANSFVPKRFAIFQVHLSKVLRLPRKSDARSYEVQNHLSLNKPEDLMLQNATSLRKSAPSPPNSSDEDVSCTAPATENASFADPLQMPHACHGFLEMRQNHHFLLTFDKVHNPLRLPRESTSERPKSAPYPSVFCTFDFEMCFVPQQRALFRHLNFQKWSKNGVFCTF